jgi:hypothetical protein
MPKISEIFSSRHLKVEHLNNKPRIATIEGWEQEESYGEQKYVLYLEGERRALRLNWTLARDIAKLCGDDMANWAGHEIELYPTQMDITDKDTKEKKTIDVIRARASAAPSSSKAVKSIAPRDDMDDKIPF